MTDEIKLHPADPRTWKHIFDPNWELPKTPEQRLKEFKQFKRKRAQKIRRKREQAERQERIKAGMTPEEIEDDPRVEFQRPVITNPDHLFTEIVGIQDIIADLRNIIRKGPLPIGIKGKPNVMLEGPTSTAKSLICENFLKLPDSMEIGPDTSSSGLIKMLAENPRIKWLVCEEFEKMCKKFPEVQSTILTWAWDGKVVSTKGSQKGHQVFYSNAIFIAAVNSTDKLSDAMMKRFYLYPLKNYTQKEFKQIAYLTLTRDQYYPVARPLARAIANYSWKYGNQDMKQVLMVGRQCETIEEIEAKFRLLSRAD